MENKKLLDWFLLFSAICTILLVILLYNVVFGDSCQAQSCGAETMPTVVANSEEIWTTDHELIKLLEEAEITPETIKNNNIETLHAKICKTTSKSPLCEDIEILRRIDSIAKEKWVPTGLIIGIMHAESSLSTNYNKPICKTRNNPYWIKGRKFDNGKTVMYNNGKGRDSDWCYLYHFDSIDEATYSLANTISIGYKGCNNSVRCLSRKYVGDPEVEEESWIGRVNKFAQIR